jgi:hypothetical protein
MQSRLGELNNLHEGRALQAHSNEIGLIEFGAEFIAQNIYKV